MKIELWLPIPVTVNKLYHNAAMKGRAKTKTAKCWAREAQYVALPFAQAYREIVAANVNTRAQYWRMQPKGYDLQGMHRDHPDLRYAVTYRYYFPSPRATRPCDVFNFEKQLSDFLVDIGFMLDDSFIEDGRVIRMPPDPKNPRVEIEIISLD